MTQAMAMARFLARKAAAAWMTPYMAGAVITIAASFALIAVVTRLQRGRWPVSRELQTDAAYVVFYLGGFYTFIIGAPLFRLTNIAVARFAPWLRVNLLEHTNAYAQYILVWLAMDLTSYWWHRAAHRLPVLWEFHRVHHSETLLQPLTNYRFHFIDLTLRMTLQTIPVLLLGASTTAWLAAAWFEILIDSLAHADVGWTYGPLGRIFINPAFHRIHHSTDRRHYERNYSLSFTMWDHLFGTAYAGDVAPVAYGVDEAMPRSFLRQFFFPFAVTVRKLTRRVRTAASAAGTPDLA